MKQSHIKSVLSQIEHLYRSSRCLQKESIEVCKELENTIDDNNIIVAGFLSNFHKLFQQKDQSFDKSAQQLRMYGFDQNVVMPIWLLKYIGKNDPMSMLIKKDNHWFKQSQIIYNSRLIVSKNPPLNQNKLYFTREWDRYFSEVSAALYRSSRMR